MLCFLLRLFFSYWFLLGVFRVRLVIIAKYLFLSRAANARTWTCHATWSRLVTLMKSSLCYTGLTLIDRTINRKSISHRYFINSYEFLWTKVKSLKHLVKESKTFGNALQTVKKWCPKILTYKYFEFRQMAKTGKMGTQYTV